MKITIFAIGKIKSKPVRELVEDYSARINHYLKFEIINCRDEKSVLSKIKSHEFLIVLDERGTQKSSKDIAGFISEHQLRGTRNLVFFIGGQDGVGKEIRDKAHIMLGLSRMTFPHEFVQVILSEQIYRACSIIKGEPYHR